MINGAQGKLQLWSKEDLGYFWLAVRYLRAVSLAGEMAGPKLQAMTPELVPHQIIPGHVKSI